MFISLRRYVLMVGYNRVSSDTLVFHRCAVLVAANQSDGNIHNIHLFECY